MKRRSDFAARRNHQDEATERATREHWQGQLQDAINARGKRYAHCTLENFEVTSTPQKTALEDVKAYRSRMKDNILQGTNVILYGPRGTGKDHLLTAMMLELIRKRGAKYQAEARLRASDIGDDAVRLRDCTIHWVNGLDIFSHVRSAGYNGENLAFKTWTAPTILYVSDPLPPSGVLTDWQQGVMFRILDDRYRNCLPTWVTVNVSNGKELDERLAPQNADRLRDGAVVIPCDWQSYRKAGRQ